MKIKTQIYIDSSDFEVGESVNYERLDLFDFESIDLTSSIQDARDISKVFTDFSQQFSIPASDNNNRVFKHYYNNSIENGFDARVKRKAIITLNGITFREGYLRLNDVVLKDSRPHSYKVVFFGALTMLKDVIGDDELTTLEYLSRYNHDYTLANVFSGFNIGLGYVGGSMSQSTNRDVIYPSISARDKLFYDSSGETAPADLVFAEGQSINMYDSNLDGSHGIDYLNLKPAVKLKNIIDAIEDRYDSISFSQDFFSSVGFSDLYLLLHNHKGYLSPTSSVDEEVSQTFLIGSGDSNSDFKLDAAQTEVRPIETRFENVGSFKLDVQQYDIITSVTVVAPVSNSKYSLEILDGDEVLQKLVNVSGNQTLTATVCSREVRNWTNLRVRVSADSGATKLTTYAISLELKQRRYRIPASDETPCSPDGVPEETISTFYSTTTTNQTFLSTIEITQHLPKFKIIDLLKGLFTTFNLTAYIDDGVIVVKPLIDFYDEGSSIDITSMVDESNLTVSRRKLYDNISFKFKEPKTFGIINKNTVSQVDFGNLEYQATEDGRTESLIFDGGKYEVKSPFEKLYYERFSDEADLAVQTPMSSGWLADKDQNPTLTAPIIFYNVPTDVNTTTYKVGFLGQGGFSKYNRASNTNSSELFSLHFGIEFDEYSTNEITNSLFHLRYSEYIKSLFSKLARRYSLKMIATLDFLLKYNINDTLVIRDKDYFINNIRTNLSNGETTLELIDTFAIIDDTTTDTTDPSQPTGLALDLATDSSLSFSWNASTDNIGVTGYKIYVDSSYLETIGNSTSHTIIVDNAGTSYDIQVSAIDGSGNESILSSVVAMSTTALTDTEAPKKVVGLSADTITVSSIDVSWDAGIDNVGVTSYEVYVDGLLDGSTASLTYSVTGLSPSTTYEIKVRAKDAAGNAGSFSNVINPTTSIL